MILTARRSGGPPGRGRGQTLLCRTTTHPLPPLPRCCCSCSHISESGPVRKFGSGWHVLGRPSMGSVCRDASSLDPRILSRIRSGNSSSLALNAASAMFIAVGPVDMASSPYSMCLRKCARPWKRNLGMKVVVQAAAVLPLIQGLRAAGLCILASKQRKVAAPMSIGPFLKTCCMHNRRLCDSASSTGFIQLWLAASP